jgi:hypothetical protein
MKRVLLMLLVSCFLISTAYDASARDIYDVGSPNFDAITWQLFDNRNDLDSGLPAWANLSKGDYFLIDAMIVTGGSLQSFADITEVTVKPTAYSYLNLTLFRYEDCNSYLGIARQEFFLYLRYSPWMQTSDWVYTLKYYDSKRRVHFQSFQRPGADANSPRTAPIEAVNFSSDNNTISWIGIGAPSASVTYKLRIIDSYGCIINEVNYPNYSYAAFSNTVSFNVSALRGQVVRAENRLNASGYGQTLPAFGLTARSTYTVKVPD